MIHPIQLLPGRTLIKPTLSLTRLLILPRAANPFSGPDLTSPLGTSRAFVPAAEEIRRQDGKRRENRDAGRRDQGERREHARDVQTIACFGDRERGPTPLARVPRREFGDDRADKR